MTYLPQVAPIDAWVKHFKEMSEQKHKPSKFSILGSHQGAGQTVSLVTPLAQSLQRAKAEVKESRASQKTTRKSIKARKPRVKKKVIKGVAKKKKKAVVKNKIKTKVKNKKRPAKIDIFS